MKLITMLALLTVSLGANATIVYQRNVQITQINAYDDVPAVAAYVYLSTAHPDCPNGAYLNPSAANFSSLYALVIAAFMAGKSVDFQMYNDRLSSGRCETDAVWVYAQ